MFTDCILVDSDEILDRQKVGNRHGDTSLFIEPGMMWFMPWIWDHQDPDAEQYLPALLRAADQTKGKSSLSLTYLSEWATLRDPIALMLPTATIIHPDATMEDGTTFRVLGSLDRLSIDRYVIVCKTHRYRITDGRISLQGQIA